MKKKITLIVVSILSFLIVAGMSVFIALNPYIFRYYFDGSTFDITEKDDSDEITVMSFNIRYKASSDRYKKSWYYRAGLALEVIRQEQPDVIGFQEAQVIHEKYFRKHLKGYDFKIGYREENKEKEGCLICYRNDIFEAGNAGLFWLSETPDVQSKGWGSDHFRVASYISLKDKNTNKTYTFIDTHLDHIKSEAREKGMGVIINKIDTLNLISPILMGDMNDTEGSPMYQAITTYGLNDAQKVAGEVYVGEGSTYQGYGEYLGIPRIDFFFVGPSISINDYHVVDKTFNGIYPSDHFPIVMCYSR